MKKLETVEQKKAYYEKLFRKIAFARKEKNREELFRIDRLKGMLFNNISRQIKLLTNDGESDNYTMLKDFWNFHGYCFDKYFVNYKRIRKVA